MKINIHIFLLLFMVSFCSANSNTTAPDVILKSRSATALNKVILYPDSTFFSNALTSFDEGELFEVISESKLEHEDDDQNQKFKWFKVRTINNQKGWVFGDAIAVVVPTHEIDIVHKKIHKQALSLDNGFEKSLMWIAAVEGRDNFHKKDYMNPIYNEKYLVITNELGKSVHINIAGENARGRSETQKIKFQDITADAIPEIIVEQSSFPLSNKLENKNLIIYSMQSGTLRKVFEERMTLNYKDDTQSPAISKFIEINKDIIRIEYVDYVKCSDYKQDAAFDKKDNKMERCMELVTYAYIWDSKNKTFESLFDETRIAPTAFVKPGGLNIKMKPSLGGPTVISANRTDQLKVIKHFEKTLIINGKRAIDTYLFVQHPSGKSGYLKAKDITFNSSNHKTILENFYSQSFTSKNDFKVNRDFIVIKK